MTADRTATARSGDRAGGSAPRQWTITALLLAGTFGLAGCGSNAVEADRVAAQISDQLEQVVGQRPDSVTCPTDLPAVVGESIRCELAAGRDTLGVTATVTSVEGTTANFDIKVDQRPRTGT